MPPHTWARAISLDPRDPQRERKPKRFKLEFPGHCVALDTLERHRYGLRRYLIAVTGTLGRLAFAPALPTHNSAVWKTARSFFSGLCPLPSQTTAVSSANTSPNSCVNGACGTGIPCSQNPKMNAHGERLNRTLGLPSTLQFFSNFKNLECNMY
ncbi:MAG: hypothetical protein LBI87_12315 [Candidatus Accumulibacter sp.]|jgi:hypothetical protein|nr:hypothetical protein [Accumulibacter sp.]